ncbi:MAG: ClbS/DfsB family four-helix bundle protein [Bacteroidota bacterium]
MAIPKNKEELIEAIETTYAKLQLDLHSIQVEEAASIELEGHAKGTQMSVANLVAYLIGWGQLVLKWQRKIAASEEVVFPEEGFKWTDLGLLAQKFYKDHQGISYPDLLNQLNETVQQILEMIEEHSNEELYGSQWYKHYSMGRMIQLNTSSPYKNARTRVRKWKRSR